MALARDLPHVRRGLGKRHGCLGLGDDAQDTRADMTEDFGCRKVGNRI